VNLFIPRNKALAPVAAQPTTPGILEAVYKPPDTILNVLLFLVLSILFIAVLIPEVTNP
jgi:hypothetical protein